VRKSLTTVTVSLTELAVGPCCRVSGVCAGV
jgi:hypothetical protein